MSGRFCTLGLNCMVDGVRSKRRYKLVKNMVRVV